MTLPFETIPEALDAWATRTPDAPALVIEGREPLTHGGLAEVRSTLAARLNAAGFGRNDRIAIVHPGGPEGAATVIGVYGCATAVPLNPDATLGEFVLCFRDMRIQALVVAADFDTPAVGAAQHLNLPVFRVEGDPEAPAGWVTLSGETDRPPREAEPVRPDDIAVLFRTSGSTSHSKTVPTLHRHFRAAVGNVAALFEQTAADRCLNLMPLFHQHGLSTALSVPLSAGGSVICMADFDIETFFRWLVVLRPTWYSGSYTFHHAVAAHAADYREYIEGASLRFARTASGRLEPEIAEQLETSLGIPLLQTYACSEASIIAGNPLPPRQRKLGSVGMPITESVVILDADGTQLPSGETGEVSIRGPNVFEGYENDATANAAAFANGWFRTGDEGYFDDDGYLFLTGRIKEVINRGGEKVTPSEVDAALLAHPAVRQASTFAVPHPTLGEEVAAAVVLEPDGDVSAEALSGFVRERLAGFKAPRRIVFADEIPLGPTGKVQRRLLAAAFGLDGDGSAAGTGNGSAAGAERAASEIEARLAALWADALGLDHVGLDEDFFLLGGDSLQAVELFLRVEKAFGQRLPRSVLFEAGTVSAMARHIAAAVPSSCIVPIQPEGVRSPFFCVHGGTGEVLNFRDLAKHLGPDQPFYAIQASGLDGAMGPSGPLVRVEDIAAHYIGEMKKVQPSGPYYLGGFSYGGRVAFVMARQLRAAGERVDLLALLDPYSRMGRLREPLKPWLGSQWQVMRSLGAPAVPGYLWRRMRRFSARWSERGRLLGLRLALRHYRGREEALPGFLRRPEDVLSLARDSYRPEPYAGSAVLFQAERNIRTPADAHAGWRELVQGGLEVYPLACKHHEIMEEPYVQDLARELTTRLNGKSNGTGRASPDTP